MGDSEANDMSNLFIRLHMKTQFDLLTKTFYLSWIIPLHSEAKVFILETVHATLKENVYIYQLLML